jgi:hypothetical protein
MGDYTFNWITSGWCLRKSLAMTPCGLLSYRKEADLALPRPSESRGMKNSQRPTLAEAVGCTIARYGKPKWKFRFSSKKCDKLLKWSRHWV